MTQSVITIPIDSTLVDVVDYMRKYQIRHLPVFGSRLRGIISISDIYQHLDPGSYQKGQLTHRERDRLAAVRTRDVMKTRLEVCDPATPVDEAIRRMLAHKIHSLPVFEDSKLVGIITETDIYAAMQAMLDSKTGQCIRIRIDADQRQAVVAQVLKLSLEHEVDVLALIVTPERAQSNSEQGAGETSGATGPDTAAVHVTLRVLQEDDDFCAAILEYDQPVVDSAQPG